MTDEQLSERLIALESAVRARAPIKSISVGDPLNWRTWKIDFDFAATRYQREAAEHALRHFSMQTPVPIPSRVSMLNFKLAIAAAGHWHKAGEALRLAQNPAQHIVWEHAREIDRGSAVVVELARRLGLQPDDVDALFLAATRISFDYDSFGKVVSS